MNLTSVHVRFENCTPKSGPLEAKSIPGGKCSWMMKEAVRVVNALPLVAKTAAVPAFVIAARIAGSGNAGARHDRGRAGGRSRRRERQAVEAVPGIGDRPAGLALERERARRTTVGPVHGEDVLFLVERPR